MAGIRDDSAGKYGQWTNDPNQSWGEYLKMLGMDAGEGAYNALANITGGLSPIGTSPEGNMALQVPPMVSGLYDSAKRIGERGGFTRVEEFDAPLKQDLANALLTFYGGNALAGVAKPRGALGAGVMRDAGGLPMDQASRMARAKEMGFDTDRILNHTTTAAPFDEFKLPEYADGRVHAVYASPNKSWEKFIDTGNGQAHTRELLAKTDKPFLWDGNNMEDTARRIREIYPEWEGGFYGGVNAQGKDAGHTMRMSYGMADALKANGYDSLHAFRSGNALDDEWAFLYPEKLRDVNAAFDPARAGENGLLLSDNKPSILGAALATAGEQPIRAYRGATNAGNIARDDASILWGSSSPEVASTYARPHFTNYDIEGAVAPLDMDFRNPLTVDANGKHWAELEHGGQRYTADDLANLAKSQGHDGLIVKNVMDTKSWYPGEPRTMPADTYVALQRGTVKSPLTGETLFSDNKPSILGAALATAGEQPSILGKIPSAFDQDIQSAGSFQPPGVYKMNALEALLHSKVMNAPGVQRMRNGEMVEVPPLNDLANASEALSPYDISALDKAWRNKTRQTGELFSRPVPLPPQQEDNLPPWLKF